MPELLELPKNAPVEVTMAVMANNMKHMSDDVADIKEDLKGKFVSKEKHDALEDKVKLNTMILFGIIGTIVIGFMTAAVNFFINRPS